MGVDFGTALVMLLRWFGSVALIIVALALVTLFADRIRGRFERKASDEVAATPHHATPVQLRPVAADPQRHDVADLAHAAPRSSVGESTGRSDVIWEEDRRAG